LKADHFDNSNFLNSINFGKQPIKHSSIIFLLPELWIHCEPLTWQEQEDLGPEAHFGALLGALYFCACIGR